MPSKLRLHPFLLASALLFPIACDGGEGDDEATDDTGENAQGQEYYEGELSAGLGAEGNQARCSTCHSADGTLAGFSGQSMADIAFKDSYKGGDAPDLLAAVNECVVGWMGGTALADTAPEYMALAGYLESISDPMSTTANMLAPEVLADEAAYEAAYAGGDAAAGAAKYTANCSVCHDAGLQVGLIPAYPKATLASFTVGRIAQKVRTSGPPPSGTSDASDTTPAPMPFFEAEELSAADLADIIAHLKGA